MPTPPAKARDTRDNLPRVSLQPAPSVNSATQSSDFRNVAGMHHATGMLGIALGTLAAVLLIPEDYYEPGGLRLSVIALCIGLLSGPALSSLTDLRVWIRAESVMLLGLIYWLLMEPLGLGYSAYQLTREALVEAFILIGLFGALILAGSRLAHLGQGLSSQQREQSDFSTEWLFGLLLVASLLGLMARLIPCSFSPACMIDGLFRARGEGPWNRGVIGDSGAIVSHLGYFGYLALPLTIALHHRLQRIDWRVALGAILATLFLLYLIRDGGRRLVGMALGAGFITWLLLQPRLGPRQVIAAAGAVLGMMALLQIMLVFRLSEGGVVSNLFSGDAFESNPLDDIHVDNNFHFFVRTLDLMPEFRDFTGWEAIVYWAVRPIPRVFWPDKPISPGISIPYEMNEYWGPNFTLTISAIGDWYIAFGVWSVAAAALLMGFLGGRLVLAWMGHTLRQKLLYSLGLMWLFISLRSYLELILMTYPILALWLLSKLVPVERAPAAPAASATS